MSDSTVTERGTTPTGLSAGNPVASLSIHVEDDTAISIDTQIEDGGAFPRKAKPGEVTVGNYYCSVLCFGSGVDVFMRREDMVRLMVAVSEHLDVLDRADTADRKVASNGR